MSDNLIFIDFGAFAIYWHGIFMGAAVLIAALIFSCLRKIQKESFSSSLLTAVISMPAALVFSRIFYCWFGKSSFEGGIKDCLTLLSGGYALYGALFGIMSVLIICAVISKKSLLMMSDAAVPAVALAIAVGRFASCTSGSDIGFAISTEKLQRFPFSVWSEPEQSWILWVGFFEGIAAVIIFIFTSIMFMKQYKFNAKGTRYGDITLMFMAMYGLSQSILESMRNDSLFMVTLGFVRISQIISILLAVTAFIIIMVKNCRLQKPSTANIILWTAYAVELGVAIYCEFKMNVSVMVLHYILLAISLTAMLIVTLFTYFQNKRLLSNTTKA